MHYHNWWKSKEDVTFVGLHVSPRLLGDVFSLFGLIT